jgi:LCP family protein required for cell wall assembly
VTQTAPERTSEDFGPPLRGRHRRFAVRRYRLAVIVLGIFGVLFLGAASTLGALAFVGASGISTVDIGGRERIAPASEGAVEEPLLEGVTGITNILLVGSDSREGLTGEELLQLGTDDDERADSAGLTDTIMLVQLDAEENRASVLSFPRDLLVTLCDGSTGRINGAFRDGEDMATGGGPSCLVETVETLTGVPIDHYVQIDFEGFIDAVNELGGVTFYVEEPLTDERAGLDIPAGCVTFDGAKALAFVRARYLDPEADLGRVARQQRFLREMLDKATSLDTLTNPSRLLGFVRAMGNAVTTDEGLSSALDRANLAWTFRSLSNEGIDTHVVPAYDDVWNGAEVLIVDDDRAEPLFAQFRAGSRVTPSPSAVASPSPSAVLSPGATPPSAAPSPVPTVEPEPTFLGAARSAVEC